MAVMVVGAVWFGGVGTASAQFNACKALQIVTAGEDPNSGITGCKRGVDTTCRLSVDVRCGANCGASCDYNFDETGVDMPGGLEFTGPAGIITSDGGRSITIRAKRIADDGSADIARVRSTDGASTPGSITLIGTMTQAEFDALLATPQTDDDTDIELAGHVIATVGPTAAPVSITGHSVVVDEVDTSTSLSGSSAGQAISITSTSTAIVVTGGITSEGRGGAGAVTLTGNRSITISTGTGIDAQKNSTNPGAPGAITITSNGKIHPDPNQSGVLPAITISRELRANAVGGVSHGANVTIGTAPGFDKEASVTIAANVKSDSIGVGGRGGNITVSGLRVIMTAGELFATGSGTGGHGGDIIITATDTGSPTIANPSAIRYEKLTSRSESGGNVTLRTDGVIDGQGPIQVASSTGAAGRGGSVTVMSVSTQPRCFQVVNLRDVYADGHGLQGVGGSIAVRGAAIVLPQTVATATTYATTRWIRANANASATNPGLTAGMIDLRSADPLNGNVRSGLGGIISLARRDGSVANCHKVWSMKIDGTSSENRDVVVTDSVACPGEIRPGTGILPPAEFITCAP